MTFTLHHLNEAPIVILEFAAKDQLAHAMQSALDYLNQMFQHNNAVHVGLIIATPHYDEVMHYLSQMTAVLHDPRITTILTCPVELVHKARTLVEGQYARCLGNRSLQIFATVESASHYFVERLLAGSTHSDLHVSYT